MSAAPQFKVGDLVRVYGASPAASRTEFDVTVEELTETHVKVKFGSGFYASYALKPFLKRIVSVYPAKP